MASSSGVQCAVDGENVKLNAALKSSCEKRARQINFNRRPTDEERGQAMQDFRDQLRAQFPAYNVMVVYPPHQKKFQHYAHCKVGTNVHSLDVYIFKSGQFTLQGDGGYINWCFGGKWERNGKQVTFTDPSV